MRFCVFFISFFFKCPLHLVYLVLVILVLQVKLNENEKNVANNVVKLKLYMYLFYS